MPSVLGGAQMKGAIFHLVYVSLCCNVSFVCVHTHLCKKRLRVETVHYSHLHMVVWSVWNAERTEVNVNK